MWVVAFFTYESVPKTGLSPIVDIKDIADGSTVVSSGSMLDKGAGFYAYDFSSYDTAKDYTVLCDSVTLSGTERYTHGASGEYNDAFNAQNVTLSGIDTTVDSTAVTVTSTNSTVNNIDSTVTDIDVRTELIRKLGTNKLVLQDGTTDNWILYDDDSTTPVLTFSVTDKSGGIIVQPVSTPSIRYKAT